MAWQRHRVDRKTLRRYYQAIVAADPEAEGIDLTQDTWPVHVHADVLAALPAAIHLLPLPTYAPWTNPVEDLWRVLNGEVPHHHVFGDDWAALQEAVTAWLAQWHDGSTALLHLVGLCPE
ncbi:MAG: transposase [Thermomicrobiales bacterium]|nr:transposase [Thermomicrobiales bacterium]